MTLIAQESDFKSKETLLAALESGCMLHEPSIMGSWTRKSTELPVGFKDIVTNGAKRTKFRTIERTAKGWVVK